MHLVCKIQVIDSEILTEKIICILHSVTEENKKTFALFETILTSIGKVLHLKF
ncbi:hypothetical protein XBKQ1_2190002 [Xenorhabdus bovienii str. kraussei Quebec]|uniref:Uncharacterized protein n=1 Tax=Xenorhabdus bovienii str. kraussei Quebec TaxID=1398203 RepID=A0A077PIL4_XENBV|nr:hypothetical protein XBKQ1_2190002 [Xenorhabdus bovienii str. kraussei Quebec]